MATRGLRVKDALRWSVWGPRVLVRGAVELAALFLAGGLARAIEPWMRVDSLDALPFEVMAASGARAVLFDLENTLTPPGGPFGDEARRAVARARAAGLGVGVISNASATWVGPALEAEGLAFVAPAGKPSPRAFASACALLGVSPDEAVYVGDQIITDVLGAQRAGLRAVLLTPRYSKEFWSARFQRAVARLVVRLARGET